MTKHKTLTGEQLHDAFQYVQTSDPGAVGAGKNWLDTTSEPYIHKRRNDDDDDWVTVGGAGGSTSMNAVLLIPAYWATKSGTWQWYTTYQFYNSSHANGDFITFDVWMNAGTYDLYFEHATAADRAIADFLVDGVSVGTVDTNASTVDHVVAKITGFSVAVAGLKVFKILVNGHTGSDYYLLFQSVYLVQKT